MTSRNQGLSSNDQGRQRRETLGTRLTTPKHPMTSLFLDLYWPPSWSWRRGPDNLQLYILLTTILCKEISKRELAITPCFAKLYDNCLKCTFESVQLLYSHDVIHVPWWITNRFLICSVCSWRRQRFKITLVFHELNHDFQHCAKWFRQLLHKKKKCCWWSCITIFILTSVFHNIQCTCFCKVGRRFLIPRNVFCLAR